MKELDAVNPAPQPDVTQLFINGLNGNVDRVIDSRGKNIQQTETATPDADTARLIDLFKSGLDGNRQAFTPAAPTDNVTQAFLDGLNGIRRNTDTTTTAEDAKAIVENKHDKTTTAETATVEPASDLVERIDVDDATKQEYNQHKETIEYQLAKSRQKFDQKAFFTKNDPARDYFGSADKSNPQELKTIIDNLTAMGVKIIYRQGVMAYQPNPCSGKPGQIVIDPEASFLAWKHEEKHATDDYEAGWRGFRFFTDPHQSALLEKSAYDLEIRLASELGVLELVKKLDTLKQEEMGEYYE